MTLKEIKEGELNKQSLKTLQELADRQVKEYRKAKNKINSEEDPTYTEEKKEFEVSKQRQILDKNIETIEKTYQDLGNEHIAELERDAALNIIEPSKSDRDLAAGLIDEAKFHVAMAYTDAAKQEAVGDLNNKIQHLDTKQQVALRNRLPELLSQAGEGMDGTQRKIRNIGNGLSEIRTEEQAALEFLKREVAGGAAKEYRNMKIAEKSRSDVFGME